MREGAPRIAFFTDCFHEVNGVAHTSRQFVRFAAARQLPFLVANAAETEGIRHDGTVTHVEYRRGFARLPLDVDMAFDLNFPSHLPAVASAIMAFRPDLIHLTGPGDCGLLGLLLAHRFRIPVVASWHTNLHEYAARRLPKWVPARETVGRWAERQSLVLIAAFYRYARRTLAPNPESVRFLENLTGKPCGLMARGVDTELFHPAKRLRECDEQFRIGYVGRLSGEKNVRWLVETQRKLESISPRPFHFSIVGQGAERPYLEQNLRSAFFRGVLRGENLARAYADFDVLLFPSETDTYGNAVLEALASGVPAVVTGSGGPKFLVADGETGFIRSDPAELAAAIQNLMRNPARHAAMRGAARRSAMKRSWDAVFEDVYCNYRYALRDAQETPATPPNAGARKSVAI